MIIEAHTNNPRGNMIRLNDQQQEALRAEGWVIVDDRTATLDVQTDDWQQGINIARNNWISTLGPISSLARECSCCGPNVSFFDQ